MGTIFLVIVGTSDNKYAVSMVFLLIWVSGSFFIYLSCARFKKVVVSKHFLYISNYLIQIKVPLSDIFYVEDDAKYVWWNLSAATIHLKNETEFGDEIIFIPTSSTLRNEYSIVDELNDLRQSNQKKVKSL